MKAASKRAYETVAERAGGVCEGCGERPAENMHHRLYRSHGGPDTVANLIALCGMGNVTGCHGIAHKDGYERGWSIRRSVAPEDQPANRPVMYRGRFVRLLDDGGVQEVKDT